MFKSLGRQKFQDCHPPGWGACITHTALGQSRFEIHVIGLHTLLFTELHVTLHPTSKCKMMQVSHDC